MLLHVTLYPVSHITIVNDIHTTNTTRILKQLQHLYSLQVHKRTATIKPVQAATRNLQPEMEELANA